MITAQSQEMGDKSMRIKKVLSLVLILTLTLALTACGAAAPAATEAPATGAPAAEAAATAAPAATEVPATAAPTADDVQIRIGALTGPTAIGMVKLFSDADAGIAAGNYTYTLAGSADELTPLILQGELDVAAVPVNLGSVLYNKTTGGVEMACVNTLGVLYIVEKGGESIQSMADLKGHTIYATGKGSTPEYTLRYLLTQNGLDPDKDVTLEWKSEPAEVVSLMSTEETAVAMLPQPYVTVALNTLGESARVALSLNDEWTALDNGTMLITAGLLVQRSFAEAHPAALAAFLTEYEDSIAWVNGNVEDAAALCEQYGIVKAAVAKTAIPACNVTYIAGADMKTALSGFLDVLFRQNPTAVGGALPADDFYYGCE